MKTTHNSKIRFVLLGAVLACLTLATSAMALDQVIVLAKPSGFNSCPPWCENAPVVDWSGSGSSSHSSAPGDTATGCTFAYTNSGGPPSITITPTLAFSGGTTCYQVDITHISGNASPNLVIGVTVTGATLTTTPGGTTAVTQTIGFNSTNGINAWYTIGYLTNLTTTTPSITFTYVSGTLAATGGRWYTDGYRFTQLGLPCQNTPQIIAVNGPLAAGQAFVNVPNVTNTATKVTVYSDDGITQTSIGSLTVSGVTNAAVPVSGLVKGRYITATQTVAGQESCTLAAGTGAIVGGGANTLLGFCLDMQQDAALTGPIGANGTSTSTDLYFLGADGRQGGFGTAPADPTIITPSTCWQTVYIDPTTANYFHWSVISSNPDPNHFAQLDALAIAIEDTDTGPYDIYIDNFKNGNTVIQDWEAATVGQTVGFSQPSFSSTTSGFLLAQVPGSISPNISVVTTNHADSGSKSLHVNWQFINTLSVNWIRLNALNHPQLDLTKPISFRVLALPVGVTNGDMKISAIADQTQNTGASANFNVSATGVGPFTYQWSFNGTNVVSGGNSSSYTVSNLTTNNAGRYMVAVGDGNGCTNYSSANLTVNATITPVSITISYDGTHAILNWPGSHTLQSAPAVNGTYTDVAGPVLTGPYQVVPTGSAKFFRLRN